MDGCDWDVNLRPINSQSVSSGTTGGGGRRRLARKGTSSAEKRGSYTFLPEVSEGYHWTRLQLCSSRSLGSSAEGLFESCWDGSWVALVERQAVCQERMPSRWVRGQGVIVFYLCGMPNSYRKLYKNLYSRKYNSSAKQKWLLSFNQLQLFLVVKFFLLTTERLSNFLNHFQSDLFVSQNRNIKAQAES